MANKIKLLDYVIQGDYQLFNGEQYEGEIDGKIVSVNMSADGVSMVYCDTFDAENRTLGFSHGEYYDIFGDTGLIPGSHFILGYEYLLNDGEDPNLQFNYLEY